MNAKLKIEEQFTPSDLARLAVESAPGPLVGAVDWALDWLRNNPEFRDAHRDDAERCWMNNAVGKVNSDLARATGYSASRNASSPTVVPLPVAENRMAAAVADNYSRMMDFPLWGTSKRIGDCTPAEIRASAENFGKVGRTMLRKERWQLAVAEAAEKNSDNPNAPIRDSLPERTLLKLWEETDV